MFLKEFCSLEEISMKHEKEYLKYKKAFSKDADGDMLRNMFLFTFITEFYEIINWYQHINCQTTLGEKIKCLNASDYTKIDDLDLPQKIYFLRKNLTGKILGTLRVKCYYDVILKRFVPEVSYEIRPDEQNKGYGKMMINYFLNQNHLDVDKFLIRIYNDNLPSLKLIKNLKFQKIGESTNYTKKIINHFCVDNSL